MGSPNLLPPDPPDPSPAPTGRRQTEVVCEFCECALTPSGEYIRLSDRAKELRGQGERIEALKAEIAERQTALDEAIRALDEARSKIAQLEAPKTKAPLW